MSMVFSYGLFIQRTLCQILEPVEQIIHKKGSPIEEDLNMIIEERIKEEIETQAEAAREEEEDQEEELEPTLVQP